MRSDHPLLGHNQYCANLRKGRSMQWLWCWRCKVEMPMLDEQEFAEIASLHRLGMQSIKQYREDTGVPLERVPLAKHFEAMLRRYEEITGHKETNPNAVAPSSFSVWSPMRSPLRSPQAKSCVEPAWHQETRRKSGTGLDHPLTGSCTKTGLLPDWPQTNPEHRRRAGPGGARVIWKFSVKVQSFSTLLGSGF
jgi:hypothetical protein